MVLLVFFGLLNTKTGREEIDGLDFQEFNYSVQNDLVLMPASRYFKSDFFHPNIIAIIMMIG
ncbi:hypothetical protein DIT68_02280 [Brumimicrobium oceani]|uniref:Uncharacterized protein n=1 Tax=Brumimicrobium oceani TaxID=2100725 RepID=A0A2U2XH94_9FLAO|nr:hypothetical protein DIT68_02280 [Brumimicrobium oceani]